MAKAEILTKIYRNFFIRRFLRMIGIIIFVVSLTFFIVRLMPGNPIEVFISNMISQYGMSYQEARQQALSLFSINLNEPLYLQFLDYLSDLFRGNLGTSYLSTGTPVSTLIAGFLPWTLFSVSLSLLVSFTIGIALGMYIAYHRGGITDKLLTATAVFFSSVPNYIIAILIIVFIGIQWKLYPMELMRGSYSADVTPGFNLPFIIDIFKHVLWPFVTYVITSFGGWMLSMKANTISTLGEDYVTVAKAKGLKESRITLHYVGRNAILPLFTSLAIAIGFIFGGSTLIETTFLYKGIGWLLWSSIVGRDYPVMQGCFLIITISVVISNFLADLFYGLIDPRVRVSG